MKNLYALLLVVIFFNANAQITLQSFEQNDATTMGLFGAYINGDGNQIICSSGYAASPIPKKAHVFEKQGSQIIPIVTFEQTDATTNDSYAQRVAIFGDYAAVSAPFHDSFSVNSGAVYVYHKIGGSWSLLQKIGAPDPGQTNAFGSDVRIHNNQLFVCANNLADQKNLYIYNLEADNVVLSQTLASDKSLNQGL